MDGPQGPVEVHLTGLNITPGGGVVATFEDIRSIEFWAGPQQPKA